MKKEGNSWHTESSENVIKRLETSDKGLSKEEAEKRLQKYGKNEISKKRKIPVIIEFLKQFKSPLIYILFVAMVISFAVGHIIDGYVILSILLINAIIGFVQERKAEKAIDALKKIIVSYAKAYRNKELKKIPAKKLVPGDIINLEEGDKIPADARLLEIKNFRTQEASLTGESFPQEKSLKPLDESTPLGDRTNMVFMGTMVVSGNAKAVVVSTANKTQIGQVAKSIQEIAQPKMHFTEKVKQLTIQMGIFAFVGALLTFLIGFFIKGLEFLEIFFFTIASLVSAIPEGLPAVMVIVLAIGARRMAKRKAVIRHLPAVETLGVATVIATDKTGTITKNSLTVNEIITSEENFKISGEGWEPIGKFFNKKEPKKPISPLKNKILKKILTISALCNKGSLLKKDGDYEIIGDPTEVALLVLGKKAGIEKEKYDKEKVIDDLAFSSDLKFRASLVESGKTNSKKKDKQLYSVGAFETILDKSDFYLTSDKKEKLTKEKKEEFLKEAEELAKKGIRVLGLAYKNMNSETKSITKKDVDGLTFVGLTGMRDPPRKEVKESVKKARNAGIRVLMKTGDHKETAVAIAKEIGLVGEKSKVLTEKEISEMSDLEFKEAVKKVDVFARVTPETKLRIVKALQEQGEIVAMTGDGVNDAPALKKSDIGVSMGIIGTDVARESSELVLADDNFASIVNAVEEGRIIFQNIRKTSFFLVNTSIAESITIITSLGIGLTLPMLPIQVLYLNLVTNGITDVSLAMEPGHGDVLNRPPRNKKEGILNKEMIPFLIIIVILMVAGTIPLFINSLPQGIDKARTVAFLSISMFSLFNVLNMRSLNKSIFRIGFFSNKWIIWGLILSFLATIAIIYIPGISNIFSFTPLDLSELLIITLVASSVFIVIETYKFIKNKIVNNKK